MRREIVLRKKPANLRAIIILPGALIFLLVFAGTRHQEAHPPTPHRHPGAQKLKNPISSDESSIAEGRKIYMRHCASCHGPSGKGDGSMALAGGTPSNLTDETWDHGSSDGEIFVVIRDGVSSDMESYKDKLNEKQIWQLVNYIRSLTPKK